MTESARVKLTLPLKIGEKSFTEVNIRRPKVHDLRAMERARELGSTEMDQGIAIAATLCDIPLEAMDEMDAADFASISEVLAGFFPQAPASRGGGAS